MPRIEEVIKLYPKQEELYGAIGKYRYIYYGGARGGGKTHAACAVALRLAFRYPGVNIVIVRETVEEIKQYIVPTIEYIFPSEKWKRFYAYRERERKYVFANGSLIFLRPLANMTHVRKEQGIERNVYVIDEANNIPIEFIKPLDGSLRNSRLPSFKPCMIMTGNPGGISDSYFYTHFVDVDYTKWSPDELSGKNEYCFIPAKLEDNPSLNKDTSYRDALSRLPENLKRAWLEGRWDVFSGQFFEEWVDDIHTVKDFRIPGEWSKWRSIDVGRGTHPSVCLWFAQDPESKTVYCYREFIYYGGVSDFARGIVDLSVSETGEREEYAGTFADPNIFASNNIEYDLEQYFRHEGVIIERSSNNRKLGWQVVKGWLHWSRNEYGEIVLPKLRFFRSACSDTIFNLPRLKYSPSGGEDCDTRGNDDHADALRYFCVMVPYPDTAPAEVVQEDGLVLPESWSTTRPSEVHKMERFYFSDEENKFFFEEDDYIAKYVSTYRW